MRDYISETQSRTDIILYMIGDGSERSRYEKLVRQYHLENNVIFGGFRSGDELNQIYDISDIALGCFGFYKRRINKSSALKTREYLLEGLPIVSGCREDAFDGCRDSWFYLEFPNNDSEIDFSKIIAFYEYIYGGRTLEEVRNTIRKYACNTIDINITFNPVIQYLKNNENIDSSGCPSAIY